MAKYRLTVRHGSKVAKESFDQLDEAIEAMEGLSREIRSDGPLRAVSGLRDYEPGQRVHARLELTSGRLLRGREAGIDVMGDGRLVPYVGVVRKQELEPGDGETPFDAVREVLR